MSMQFAAKKVIWSTFGQICEAENALSPKTDDNGKLDEARTKF